MKDGITTREAFKKLINTPDIHEVLGVNASTVRSWKTYLKDMESGTAKPGKVVKLEKMEEMLEKAGWKVVQEKLWSNAPKLIETKAPLPDDERIIR